jgi:hypothetical protein
MKIAMVQKLLPRPGEAGDIVPAHQPVERFLPVQGEPFETFQKVTVDKRL